jgi:hypothetical protein
MTCFLSPINLNLACPILKSMAAASPLFTDDLPPTSRDLATVEEFMRQCLLYPYYFKGLIKFRDVRSSMCHL